MHLLSIAVTSLILTITMSALQAADLQPGKQTAASVQVKRGSENDAQVETVHYLISLPDDYARQDSVPLMIFLHGRGESGENLERVKRHGPPKLVDDGNQTGFLIVSPQSPRGQWWNVAKLNQLLDHLLSTTKADPHRVYLTGLSMGGFGTWAWAASEPGRFAAAIPICGGGDPEDAEKLVDLPIWVFHGGKDNVVKPLLSKIMVNAIKSAGGDNVKLTIYPEAGHDSWTKTYDNPEIYRWLLSHKRQQ